MRSSSTFLLSTIFAILLMPDAVADTVMIAKSVPFAEDSGVTDSIRDECKFQTRLPEYIKKAAKRKVDVKLSADPLDNAEGRVLHLETTHVYGAGGGAYSGSKSATVSGELRENGEVIGSIMARRRTLIGMMPGTCSMFKRLAKKLGEDIADWLAEPTIDARVGDFKEEESESESESES